jgi:DNA-binding NarL/FixJ family response regulator
MWNNNAIGLLLFYHEIIFFKIPNKLSKQQIKCLYYLAKGYSIKGIVKAMNLSPKIIEHYIVTIKTKLQCQTRSEFVEISLKIPYIGAKLFNIKK